ncbi:ErmE/ErmH/ErmO/ErmR family 23S rRNA (adenine(2058)-N(6))-methyltransferase [Nocardiopsis sp. LDBS1602]|uniref:ErmE/ErmH/ErmO/ErmR family 23S rRNA (adenine(2058)-N(6))-methyltransferase n=1 Tax=Nocardiopsis sp. LDBS1602 TaxID=3109597 RepID=UPI002DB6D96D|nr:ErmE/ErmH/ErmO/ErmR family 23S rRNA (adenine(2058)-N(6))-methyltransferase [Nocardiopsis sp. LDBS1602]MEC3891487.1 ErmE/ErmH/ErmO/ErmR family 23S rRNA (adenine(2058)-N(6))-methyltransferase [Nocardiopsis sp. LDBS1602]
MARSPRRAHHSHDPRRPRRSNDDRRRLSQNFLTDPATARRVVRIARPAPDSTVVEVGPGDGALTRFLVREAGRVIAYEIDPTLAARLTERYRERAPDVRIVRGDFTRARPPRSPFSVVGNIPYSRTADIVRWCLNAPGLTSATFITQWEYARKRTGAYGRWTLLTVLTWPEWSWSLVGRIGRERFRPVPRVDAGVLVLRRREEPLLPREDLREYRRLVEIGFGGVGGSLSASLRRAYPARRVASALREAGVDPSAPVGLVAPDRWVALVRSLTGTGRGGPRTVVGTAGSHRYDDRHPRARPDRPRRERF